MVDSQQNERALLGRALIEAQVVEGLLYTIASELVPRETRSKRFQSMSGTSFLSGDEDDIRATLGQMAREFGPRLGVFTPDLDVFCKHRNLVSHDYVRTFLSKKSDRYGTGAYFLKQFIEDAERWQRILLGYTALRQHEAALREGRSSELTLEDLEHARFFSENLAKGLGS